MLEPAVIMDIAANGPCAADCRVGVRQGEVSPSFDGEFAVLTFHAYDLLGSHHGVEQASEECDESRPLVIPDVADGVLERVIEDLAATREIVGGRMLAVEA